MRILVLGGASHGGGASLVCDVIYLTKNQSLAGILDSATTEYKGIKVLGSTDYVEEHWNDGDYDAAIIAFAGNITARMELYNRCIAAGIPFANVIHPSVVISYDVEIGTGNVIMAHSYIGPNAKIGNNNFMSSYTGIEHDCIVGSHNTFGPNVKFSGCVEVGDTIRFGMNIGVEPRLKIGSNSILASGCMITSGVDEKTIVKARINHDKRILSK